MSLATVLPALAFRPAKLEDCQHLVLLTDMATRRLTSFLWGQKAAVGQSVFEIGRQIIREDESHFSHFKNWSVAEYQDRVIGGMNCYVITSSSMTAPSLDILKPLNELKAMAAGSWYISSAALYPEHQGLGFGKALLAEAEKQARASGNPHLTLMVGSFNVRAHKLYLQSGFEEWSRRPFLPFPGSDMNGSWILMGKKLS